MGKETGYGCRMSGIWIDWECPLAVTPCRGGPWKIPGCQQPGCPRELVVPRAGWGLPLGRQEAPG